MNGLRIILPEDTDRKSRERFFTIIYFYEFSLGDIVMDRHFFEELNSLKSKLLEMGSIAEEMLNITVKALKDNNTGLFETIDQDEFKLNRLQVEIDEYGMKLIALHQPTAVDLRFLLGVIKINSELERIGDHTTNIRETIARIIKNKQPGPPIDMTVMADLVCNMFKESLHAFVNMDTDKAKTILFRDDQVDQLRFKAINDLVESMTKDPAKAGTAVSLLLIANNLEKIADHATNIAEDVIFVAQGKDVRHHFEGPLKQNPGKK
jgi:phosphate transport system protein